MKKEKLSDKLSIIVENNSVADRVKKINEYIYGKPDVRNGLGFIYRALSVIDDFSEAAGTNNPSLSIGRRYLFLGEGLDRLFLGNIEEVKKLSELLSQIYFMMDSVEFSLKSTDEWHVREERERFKDVLKENSKNQVCLDVLEKIENSEGLIRLRLAREYFDSRSLEIAEATVESKYKEMAEKNSSLEKVAESISKKLEVLEKKAGWEILSSSFEGFVTKLRRERRVSGVIRLTIGLVALLIPLLNAWLAYRAHQTVGVIMSSNLLISVGVSSVGFLLILIFFFRITQRKIDILDSMIWNAENKIAVMAYVSSRKASDGKVSKEMEDAFDNFIFNPIEHRDVSQLNVHDGLVSIIESFGKVSGGMRKNS